MRSVAIVYATHHGHTRSIAERAAAFCRGYGLDVELTDLSAGGLPALHRADAALLISPIHVGHHDKKLVALARSERARLRAMPSALVTASLTQATAQDPSRSSKEREEARAALDQIVERFVQATGWRPAKTYRIAGRLSYPRYGFFTRFIMKRIAKSSGGSTDASREHEYTDWPAFERFLGGFLSPEALRPAQQPTAVA